MSHGVFTEQLPASALPPVDVREAWRYAGHRGELPSSADPLSQMLQQLILELPTMLHCRLCYRELPLTDGGLPFAADSASVRRWLDGCSSAVLFAATIGLEPDRRMKRYAHTSPAKALLLQALGAERVEALAELFCQTKRAEYGARGYDLTRRFSPGYGDWSLRAQREIVQQLECATRIGVHLSEQLLMTPTKSITAVFGIKEITSK